MTTDRRPSDKFWVTLAVGTRSQVQDVELGMEARGYAPLANNTGVHAEPAQDVALALLDKLDLLP